MNTKKKVLYITYDGLTDPLGQSQVLPYLVGLSRHGYEFTILSFEKKDRFARFENVIRKITSEAGIRWVPLSFTSRPPIISKFYDAVRLRRKAFALHREYKFDMVHCRSYVAAETGLAMKKRFGVKFFFDMRGFWADEKKDAGTWNQDSFIFRRVYGHYKKKESAFIAEADHIISLTDAGKKEILKWPCYDSSIPLSVIPCCSDMDHFSLIRAGEKEEGRRKLGLPTDAFVLSYLGSVGAWYMLDEMLAFFSVLRKEYKNARFLFITHSSPKLIRDKLPVYSIPEADIMIVEASRQEVPLFTKASDINISFIKPVFSKLSSSPTKLGEVLAMGIPVIVNSGVGDVEPIVNNSGGGYVIHEFNEESYKAAVEAIPALLKKDPAVIRENILPVYSLENGVQKYLQAYESVLT